MVVVLLLLVALNPYVFLVLHGTYWLIQKKLALLLVQTNMMLFFRQQGDYLLGFSFSGRLHLWPAAEFVRTFL